MITCRQLIEFIAVYVAGELDAASRIEFERHLHLCRSCRAYLETYRQTIVLAHALATDDWAADVPEELVRTILSART
jgi:anti-sigma factor RsiW